MRKLLIIALTMCLIQVAAQDRVVNIWKSTELKSKTKLHVFTPKAANAKAIIILPGGSYRYLGMEIEGMKVAKWLQEKGFAPFVLQYRVSRSSDNFPNHIQDLQRAISLVRENAADWGVNPDQIGVMGFSAGGHLAGMAAQRWNENFLEALNLKSEVSLKPNFAVMIYPVVSMEDSLAHRRSRFSLLGAKPTQDMLDYASLEKNVRNDMPPMMVVHSRGDRTVDYRNSVVMAQALEKAGVEHKFLLYTNGDHGFGVTHQKGKDALAWGEEFLKWISIMFS